LLAFQQLHTISRFPKDDSSPSRLSVSQLSLETWCEDLCNYIEVREDARGEPPELPEIPKCPGLSKPSERFEDCLSALQRGHYADELEIRKKVLLLAELVEHAVQTDIIRYVLLPKTQQKPKVHDLSLHPWSFLNEISLKLDAASLDMKLDSSRAGASCVYQILEHIKGQMLSLGLYMRLCPLWGF
jgi:hypothetical protein